MSNSPGKGTNKFKKQNQMNNNNFKTKLVLYQHLGSCANIQDKPKNLVILAKLKKSA